MEATTTGARYWNVVYDFFKPVWRKTMTMNRVFGPAKGRSLATTYNGLVYAVAYDPTPAEGIETQTRNTLEFLDNILIESKSSKHSLIQATVYLNDITMKAEMDEVWCEWIGQKKHWPQRACIEANMGEGSLIEIVVIAAEE